MEEKYKKFKEYNWVESEEWQSYYRNLYPTPPPSKILRYKKKFYRNKIDPDFDIDYKPASEQEETNNSTSSSSNQSQSQNQNTNYSQNSYQDQQQQFTAEQTFETYKAAQNLGTPIQNPMLQSIETLILSLFIMSLPFRYKTVLIGVIGFGLRCIRKVGIPQFNMNYLQALIMNENFHSFIFTGQTVVDKLNYYMMLPSIISAVMAICENINENAMINQSLGMIKPYIDMVNSKKEEITQGKYHIELAIGFISAIGSLLKINSFLTPIIYFQLMRVRYTLNPYIKQSFKELNGYVEMIKNNEKCPSPVKKVIKGVQWLFTYLGKMNTPQPGQQQQGGNGGSMCNIF